MVFKNIAFSKDRINLKLHVVTKAFMCLINCHKKRPADAHAASGLFWFARENEGFPPILKVLRLAWYLKKLNEPNYKTTCIRQTYVQGTLKPNFRI